MHGEWVPISFFLSIAVIAVFFLVLRFRGKRETQQTVRLAIEKGHELSPQLLASLEDRKRSPQSDFRRGIVGVAIGVAFAVFGIVLGEEDAVRPLLAISAFPFLIGLAYLGLSRIGGRSDRDPSSTTAGDTA
jgi:hypothetical protein